MTTATCEGGVSVRIRVLRRFGQWHWWCPTCMGGDWTDEPGWAHDAGRIHLRLAHNV